LQQPIELRRVVVATGLATGEALRKILNQMSMKFYRAGDMRVALAAGVDLSVRSTYAVNVLRGKRQFAFPDPA
jgi:hypothetical protein